MTIKTIGRHERLYVSTNESGEQTVSNTPTPGAELLKPGSRGHFDAARIYSRLLTAGRIARTSRKSKAQVYSESFGCVLPSLGFNIR